MKDIRVSRIIRLEIIRATKIKFKKKLRVVMKTYFLINCLELIRGAGSRVYLSVVIMTSNFSENAFGININF